MPIRQGDEPFIHVAIGDVEIAYIHEGDNQIYPTFEYAYGSFNSWASVSACSVATPPCAQEADVGNEYIECQTTQNVSVSTAVEESCNTTSGACSSTSDHGTTWVSDCTQLADRIDCVSAEWQHDRDTVWSATPDGPHSKGTCSCTSQLGQENYDVVSDVFCTSADWVHISDSAWSDSQYTANKTSTCDCSHPENFDLIEYEVSTREVCDSTQMAWEFTNYGTWSTNAESPTWNDTMECSCTENTNVTDVYDIETQQVCTSASWVFSSYGTWQSSAMSNSKGTCSCTSQLEQSNYDVETQQVCDSASWDYSHVSSWTTSYIAAHSLGTCSCTSNLNETDYIRQTQSVCDSASWVFDYSTSWSSTTYSGSLGTCSCTTGSRDYSVSTRSVCSSASWQYSHTTSWTTSYTSGSLGTCSCNTNLNSSDYSVETRSVCATVNTSLQSTTDVSSCSSSGHCINCTDIGNTVITCSPYTDEYCTSSKYNNEFDCMVNGYTWVSETRYTKRTYSCVQASSQTQYRKKYYDCVGSYSTQYKKNYYDCVKSYDTEYRRKYYDCVGSYSTEYRQVNYLCDGSYGTEYRRKYYDCVEKDKTQWQKNNYECQELSDEIRYQRKYYDCVQTESEAVPQWEVETSECTYIVEQRTKVCEATEIY